MENAQAHEFVQLLVDVLASDTEKVKAATAKLQKDYYTKPLSLLVLLKLMMQHDSTDLRHLAATQARTLVVRHWEGLNAQQQASVRTELLKSTLAEPEAKVRHASARVVTAVAQQDLPEGRWSDLPKFLREAGASPEAREREVGVYLLYTCLDEMGDELKAEMKNILILFNKTIEDAEPEVRINTMLALGQVAELAADEDEEDDDDEDHDDEYSKMIVAAFEQLLPKMVVVLKDVIQSEAEDRILQAFETFQGLLACDHRILGDHFRGLVTLMLEIMQNTSIADDTRTQAVSWLTSALEYRSLKMQGLRMGKAFIDASLPLIVDLPTDDDDDVLTPASAALSLIGLLADHMPTSQSVIPLMDAIGPYVISEDWKRRRAGILALAFSCEGAPEFISSQMSHIIPLLETLINDAQEEVRKAALEALQPISDSCADDLAMAHERLIPGIVRNLDSAIAQSGNVEDAKQPNTMIVAACAALDSVIIAVEEEDAATYLAGIMPKLIRLLAHPNLKVKSAAVSAVGSFATAADTAFTPYTEKTMHALSEFVQLKESEEELDLRAMTFDAMGSVAQAVGEDAFQQFVPPLMTASEENLKLGNDRVKESSYMFWGQMAKAYGENFEPFMPGVMKTLLEALEQVEDSGIELEMDDDDKEHLGGEVTLRGKKIKIKGVSEKEPFAALENDDGTPIDIEDLDPDDTDWENIVGTSAIAQEKEIVLEVLADIITHTEEKMLPYLEKVTTVVLGMLDHDYEGVRSGAVSTLWRSFASLQDVLEESGRQQEWQPGLPLKVQPIPELKRFGDALMKKTLELWDEEVDMDVVTEINRSVSSCLKANGPAVLTTPPTAISKICEITKKIMSKKHNCQIDPSDPDESEPGEGHETSESNWVVIDTAMDNITGLAAALGPQFGAEIWPQFEKGVLKFCSSSQANERTAATGCLAEIIKGAGPGLSKNTDRLMIILLKRMSDEDWQCRSNAAYAVGILCEKSTEKKTLVSNFGTIFNKLQQMFGHREKRANDNASGCLARMIMSHMESVPLEAVMPTFVEALPMKDDIEENQPVWKCLRGLYQSGDKTLLGLSAELAAKIKEVKSSDLTDEVKEDVTKLAEMVQQRLN